MGTGGNMTTPPPPDRMVPFPGAQPSAGCGKAWMPTDTKPALLWPYSEGHRDIMAAGLTRIYTLSVPKTYDPTVAYPLVFGFHGTHGTRDELHFYVNMEVAAKQNAVFIFPEGLIAAQGGTGWDISGPNDEDFQMVDALIAQYKSELCIDETRILAYGHSFGGNMSNEIGCYRGTTFRAIAPIAGGFLGGPGGCSGKVAVMYIHNPMDSVVPYAGGAAACTYWHGQSACTNTPPCGCDSPGLCAQTAQHPYDHMAEASVTDPAVVAKDVKPPVFREFEGCDPNYPVVQVDYNWMEMTPGRYHNPPPWMGEVIWKFFTRLPPVPAME
jgi:predicted esterase